MNLTLGNYICLLKAVKSLLSIERIVLVGMTYTLTRNLHPVVEIFVSQLCIYFHIVGLKSWYHTSLNCLEAAYRQVGPLLVPVFNVPL